jgi:uncharacterized membrane protein YGL010W
MSSGNKLMEMLTGYAAAHQHPFNIIVHMVGIPTIMLGVLIPLSWVELFSTGVGAVTLAQLVIAGFFLFYMTLDALFALTFLLFAIGLGVAAAHIATLPVATSGTIAAILFVGGYLAQFVGHAVEKSMPVLVKHPVQANLAAPFFTVVEVFRYLGLRDELFSEMQRQVSLRRQQQAVSDRNA